MGSTSTALTIAERVERSTVVHELSSRGSALLSLLPDEASVRRFQRVTVQALAKNPDLLDCTPDSVVSSVMEAAAMGLEPTGAIGGAHLVPFSVNVGSRENPRWEKRAQLIPDFRGVVRMLVRPRSDGTPSDVLTVAADVVKEGDEFRWTSGLRPELVHVPSMDPARSSKPTTHVYAVAELREGQPRFAVLDRARIEGIRNRGKKKGISFWDTDWDEMAKKTAVKQLAKLLPVEPALRAILAREDEAEEVVPEPVVPRVAGPRTAQLAARLRPAAPAPVQAAPDADEAEFVDVDATPEPEAAPAPAVTSSRCDAASPYDGGSEPCAREAGHAGNHRNHARESWGSAA